VTDVSELPLVELRIEPQRGSSSELRVRADGRFELRTPDDDWRLVREYSDAELDALRQAMAHADDPPLPPAIEPPALGSNPTRMTWRLRLADAVREVVVEDWGAGVAPALEQLYRELFTIPQGPAVESIWRVRVGDDMVERRVVGEAAGVPALEPMLAALYARPDPFEAAGHDRPPADLLVQVTYLVDGEPGDGLAVAPDGRAFLTESGETFEVTRLSESELAALHQAIATTGWPALPDPVVAAT
jgi:hypothetical protein